MALLSWAVLSLVCLWTSTNAVSGQPVTNHSANLCIWKGQCMDNPEHPGFDLNCYYNGPPVVATRGDNLFSLIEANCPWYITNDTAAVCCDEVQAQTLQTQVKLAQELLERCPACYKNFMKHFCATTCDPNQALFMDVTKFAPLPSNMSLYAVEKVMTYVTNDYAGRLYNSCKNVEFSQQSGKVISLLCGTTQCNPYAWLTFMGDYNQNPLTPFLIAYTFVNDSTNTSVLPPGMKPFDVPLYSCNDTDPSIRCLYIDCFNSSCPSISPIPPDVDGIWVLDKDYYDQHFNSFYRTKQIIFTTKNVSNYTVDFYSGGTHDLIFTMGPVFQMEVLQEVLALQLLLQNMEVEYTNENGTRQNITLKDVCFAPIENTYNNNCTILSVLNYFQNSLDNLNLQQWDSSGFYLMGNASTHIHYCVRNPSAPLDGDVPLPCLGGFGGPVDPDFILGGFTDFDCAGNPNYDSATAMLVTFVLNDHLDDAEKLMALAWEQAFLDIVENFKGKYVDISYSVRNLMMNSKPGGRR